MSLARITNFERLVDRFAPALLLALGLSLAAATAVVGA